MHVEQGLQILDATPRRRPRKRGGVVPANEPHRHGFAQENPPAGGRDLRSLHEYVDHFFEEVDRAAAVRNFYEASLSRDEDTIMDLLERYQTWPVDLYDYYSLSDLKDLYGGDLGFALYLVTHEVVRMVDAFAYPKLTLQPGTSLPSSPSSGYGFHNLLGAMYLQMYWLVAAGEKHITRCRQCGELIRLTAREPGPQGKSRKPRQDRRYCDDACKQRYHYQNTTKPRREAERSRQR